MNISLSNDLGSDGTKPCSVQSFDKLLWNLMAPLDQPFEKENMSLNYTLYNRRKWALAWTVQTAFHWFLWQLALTRKPEQVRGLFQRGFEDFFAVQHSLRNVRRHRIWHHRRHSDNFIAASIVSAELALLDASDYYDVVEITSIPWRSYTRAGKMLFHTSDVIDSSFRMFSSVVRRFDFA